MAEAIKNLKQKKQTEEEEDEDVVELSNSSSSEDNDDEDAGDDSVSVQETIPGVDDARLKLCVKMDPCLICAEPAVGYDSEGKLMKKIRHSLFSQGHKFNHSRLFGFLCKGLSIKPFGMVKGDWNFASTSPTIPWPFCERCEGLINSLAGIYNKLEVVKTELKERMVDGEEVYMKDELYSKHDVRFYNFRKLVLGVDFKGTVKGRMFQKPAADGNTERPTCFDESMFPPNDPGSSWANPLLSDNTDHDGDDECGDSSSTDSHRPSKKPKGV
ncbi:hypothetical protein Ocin01_17448 [Orchesella cincta]|uniref:Uncharacterized protein n=1 Tax=Orchesella cincta TaxID=48709 RepID=A0A1D2M8E7_ORCCI|nr:hypothetical protein Ocin01_17448 [Orchesella cincta]